MLLFDSSTDAEAFILKHMLEPHEYTWGSLTSDAERIAKWARL